jgi:hypothetical protein
MNHPDINQTYDHCIPLDYAGKSINITGKEARQKAPVKRKWLASAEEEGNRLTCADA